MIERELMLSAEKGDKSAMYELGCYYYDEGCFGFAFYWILKSAKKGNVDAMFMLGTFYRKGIGTKTDLKKAYKYFFKAAKRENANAMVSLVGDIMDGIYKTNDKRALELCKKAANCDLKIGQYYLGLCYYKGMGVKRNIEKARYHFTISAINGFKFARQQLRDKDFFVACASL